MDLWLILIVSALAGARTWRLLAVDLIAAPVRRLVPRVANRLGRWGEPAFEGFYCPWCAGFWYGAAWLATGLAWGDHWPWQLLAGSMAVNYVGAFLNAAYDATKEAAEDE